MANLRIRIRGYDETLPKARSLQLKIGEKEIITPRRAFTLNDSSSESRLIKEDKLRGINEIYKSITKEKLDNINSDPKSEIEFGKKLRYTFDKSNMEKELNLLIFSYENKNAKKGDFYNRPPTDSEIRDLCILLSHPYADTIIPPRLPQLTGLDYMNFLKKFIEILKSFNSKAEIMGFLPFIARNELIQLTDFYKNEGIISFIVDFEGHNPIDSFARVMDVNNYVNDIQKEYKEDCYVHALNVPFTRIKHKTDVTPAKDILTFTLGIDSFGTSHIPQKLPLNVIQIIQQRKKTGRFIPWRMTSEFSNRETLNTERMNTESMNQQEVFRVFNRKDYGYYRSDIKNLKSSIMDNSIINFDQIYSNSFSDNKLKSIRKAFNVESQGLEALEIQQKIHENVLVNYINQKKYAKDNFRTIIKVNSGLE
ncbi:MAG TPA: hypothetical protein VJ767_03715 [Nitrososphaeraceae archaeon]|nr:hypothetical protein [Nitrososphaeraceae archaeon]